MLLPVSVHSGSPGRPYKPCHRKVGHAFTDRLDSTGMPDFEADFLVILVTQQGHKPVHPSGRPSAHGSHPGMSAVRARLGTATSQRT